MSDASVADLIIQLEKKLFTKTDSSSHLADLIDDAFIEVGRGGTQYNKDAVIAWLNHKDESHYSGSSFKTKLLAEDLILLTYLCAVKATPNAEMKQAVRSSIWRLQGGKWRMLFHQATPM